MSETPQENLKKTPLYQEHLKFGARIVEFGGWAMPVQYSSIIAEHTAVRTAAGLFDVSHMGEFMVEGPEAMAAINHLITHDLAPAAVDQAIYSPMCYPNGTVVDDILVYRLAEQKFLVVVNAGNMEKDWEWFLENCRDFDCDLDNISHDVGQLALQGPLAQQVLQRLTDADLSQIRFYRAQQGVTVAGVKSLLVSRTGYTGEDGFEVYCDAADAPQLWAAILAAGADAGVIPTGLGARDTLRFEACLPLYGHEINDAVTPLEAGLGRFVKLEKAEFIGREALLQQKAAGLKRKLVGLEVTGRGIPRQGYPVAVEGREVGAVTTGTASPTLGKPLGLAYVPPEYASLGTQLSVVVRGTPVPAQVVPTPFYKRQK